MPINLSRSLTSKFTVFTVAVLSKTKRTPVFEVVPLTFSCTKLAISS